jgi:hypothetical protein
MTPVKHRGQTAQGKRLPPGVATTLPPVSNSEHLKHKQDNQQSWTLRDASAALINQRDCLTKTQSAAVSQRPMHLSSNFGNVDTVLLRIRRDKSMVVRHSFDAAASAVLLALRKNNEKLDDTDDASYLKDLPTLLDNYKTLKEMRSISLDRSHENREYIRRKGDKTEVGIVVHSGENRKSLIIEETKSNNDFQGMISGGQTTVTKKGGTILRIKPSEIIKTGPSENISPTPPSSSTQMIGDIDKPVVSGLTATTVPKFTRNTPASSAAALDLRFNSSRAILCVAGNIVFEALTPSFGEDHNGMNVLDIPQNSATTIVSTKCKKKKTRTDPIRSGKSVSSVDDKSDEESEGVDCSGEIKQKELDDKATETKPASTVNMGAVSVEAQILAQRTINVVENAVIRAKLRYQYRKDNALSANGDNYADGRFVPCESLFQVKDFGWDAFCETENAIRRKNKANKFSIEDGVDFVDANSDDENIQENEAKLLSDSEDDSFEDFIPFQPNINALTKFWQSVCLPRFLTVLEKGAGHAVYHDIQWGSRYGRIAGLLRSLTSTKVDKINNYGPHLIITTEPDVPKFASEFNDAAANMRMIIRNESPSLQALSYRGTEKRRTKLRCHFFGKASGLPEAPIHVLITSYATFFQDYIHFCQVPFETVILDDGVSFMAACDYNSSMGVVWETAVFSSNDQQIGLAGTKYKEWDFSQASTVSESTMRDAFVGLTTRHRIMTASAFVSSQRQSTEYVPISGLVDFIAPQFSSIAKEEWARSRIAGDIDSMKHFRKLISRSVIVHDADSNETDMYNMALQAFTGKLSTLDRSGDPLVPDVISDGDFVSSNKVAFSRRSLLLWLGNPNQSWLRYELGKSSFQPLLDAMKASTYSGFYCEEITTASSLTASGATGQVAGSK